MKYFIIILIACAATEGKRCKDKLQGTIIPRYANNVDETCLKVVYQGNNRVQCGNYLAAEVTAYVPTVRYNVHCKCANTTVLFIGIPFNIYDTDALVGYPYLHWLVHNVPAKDLKRGFNGQVGYTRTDYILPLNPLNDHMYTFFVYCQKKYIKPYGKKNNLISDRPSFQPKVYAEVYDLGDPLSINYFISSVNNNAAVPSPNKVN